mgnify:FL=1
MLLGEFVDEVCILRRFYIAGCNVILEAGCLGDTLGRYQLLCKVTRVESVSDFSDRKGDSSSIHQAWINQDYEAMIENIFRGFHTSFYLPRADSRSEIHQTLESLDTARPKVTPGLLDSPDEVRKTNLFINIKNKENIPHLLNLDNYAKISN